MGLLRELKMRLIIVLMLTMATIMSLAMPTLCSDDPIYDRCMSATDDPPPWCYQIEVEKIGDPKLCDNILTYWPKADGVHGWCYYRLGLKQKDCTLCNAIQKSDIKVMCRRDVCRP